MFALALTAELTGITSLKPVDTPEQPFYYYFRVQCTDCREEHANWVAVCRFEMNKLSGSRGEANFVYRCKNCKREASATISAPPTPYTAADDISKAQKLLTFDCRGCEFVDFKPDDGEWTAENEESGTKWNGIDLSDEEWFDYDEKTGQEVKIERVHWEITRS